MYCSPQENIDSWGRQCSTDCGKLGEDYYWCKTDTFSWGYCGLVMEDKNHYGSKTGALCYDHECQYHESGDYYWCHTAKDWDYCSPDVKVTYKDNPCRSNHYCGLHGSSYNWCWTSESEYDYCGPIESAECTYITSQHRNRRAPENRILICIREDKHNKRKTIFTAEPTTVDITDNRRWRNEARNLISRWNNGYLVDQARSNLITSDNLRIDMQRPINRNNQRYYNLQIQVNMPRVSGESTTVSQIIVPDGVPERYIRRAFLESFSRRARVFVDVSSQSQTKLISITCFAVHRGEPR
uniref:Uncharacterized protein n=1 Tax=Cyprinus carpio TaxID=7962 RepID=A0A8C2AXH9_CYPCA